MLEARGLDVLYGDFQILWEAGFRADAGEVVAILGPNGAGKSTLMNTLSGLIRPRRGSITFKGQPIAGLPRTGSSPWASRMCWSGAASSLT